MFDEILTELNEDLFEFASPIADAERVRAALAIERQCQIATLNAQIEHRFMDGIGEVVASIDADIFHRFGLLYGYETACSDDFLRSLLRDNPEMRVKSRADHLTLRVNGLRADASPAQAADEEITSDSVCTDPAPFEPSDRQYFQPRRRRVLAA